MATTLYTPMLRTRLLARTPQCRSHRIRIITTRTLTTLPRTPFFTALSSHDPSSTAIVHSSTGESFTYGSLLADTLAAKERLLQHTNRDEKSIVRERVALLIGNSYDYVVNLLAVLGSNAIAVPLAPAFPVSELRYNIEQSQAMTLLATKEHEAKAKDVVKGLSETLTIPDMKSGTASRNFDPAGESQGGMMLYTSGTTSRPKGVLIPLRALESQMKSLVTAWEYSSDDHLLHVLPLHHIHGTVNALLTPLFAGSAVEFLYPFNTDKVWERFAKGKPITFFTAVPTVYSKLIDSHPSLSQEMQSATNAALKGLRLNICGSAALPVPTKEAWARLSGGNVLLERYGMTEVGMALSCGLDVRDRINGSVGWPLPGVDVRLFSADNGVGDEGEIQLKGENLFQEYWREDEKTRAEFTDDGWFKTGDVAYRKDVNASGASGDWARGPAYFIQGRLSSDIIKTGGEKVSALEVEREMLGLDQVSECAVVGIPSDKWGQKVAAVVVLTDKGKTAGKDGKAWGVMDARRILRDKLVAYKLPQAMKIVDEIPRNAMGKINKKSLVKDVFGHNG